MARAFPALAAQYTERVFYANQWYHETRGTSTLVRVYVATD